MSPQRDLIFIDEKDVTDKVAQYRMEGDKWVIVFKNKPTEYRYGQKRVMISRTAIRDESAVSVFNYLKEIADAVGLKTDEGENILSLSYQRIKHIPEDCILAGFINRSFSSPNRYSNQVSYFPFGFNLSQHEAVNKALSNELSVIEGPPGTGKTQTILNIIANVVMQGKSVAVVSGNNSATKNVYEKLEKHGVAFIAALLGSTQNKIGFIASQSDIPDLSKFDLPGTEIDQLKGQAAVLANQLSSYLVFKNESALLKLQLGKMKTEYHYFRETCKDLSNESVAFRKSLKAEAILAFSIAIEHMARQQKSIGFFRRLLYRVRYGVKGKAFFERPLDEMITICQLMYYKIKLVELEERIMALEDALQNFSFDDKMDKYNQLCMTLFKAALCKKYKQQNREKYAIEELRKRSSDFISDYPVILSTTYSLRNSLSDKILYDYVIIDEASQVDIATGALALSCAKRAVIVGDTRQLPNVVDAVMKAKTDQIFHAYRLGSYFQYSNHSLLTCILELFPNVPKTLLKEHYRCHPKIIEFCNQKFYGNQLIIHSDVTSTRQPLVVYKTPPGNHARERMNQRQIDIIKEEILPKEDLRGVDLGIVTPYRNQTYALQQAFDGTSIKADTVDKFQGRENDVIILSTVDNAFSAFTDDPNRLNVAISRAKEQLILVVHGNEAEQDSNITDLLHYIEYNNFTVVQSELHSIFDMLYKGYEAERLKMISKAGRVSDFDSENLMFGLIKEVLSDDNFRKYDVVLHFPFRNLVQDLSRLDEQERRYATHPLTHLDFLIYNKLSKRPVLAIEVDGYAYHQQGTQQAGRDELKDQILRKYNFPLLRFRTNESGEREKLRKKLYEVQGAGEEGRRAGAKE